MDEIREKLKTHVGKRIRIRGCLTKFSDWQDRRLHRKVGRACISMPEMAAELLADHVWAFGVDHWPREAIGHQVEFDALVDSYLDEKVGATNYCLRMPGHLEVLHGPPALSIPDPPKEKEVPMIDYEPGNDKLAKSSLETLRQVKTFMKEIGGQEHAKKVAEALDAVTIPLPELLTWIRELSA